MPAPVVPTRTGVVLTMLVTTQLLLGIDAAVVTVALPGIGADLHLDLIGQSWIQTAYVLAFGGLLLLGGRLGDLLGRRRTLLLGVAVFTVASLAGGLATTVAWLVAARTVQGAGAALAAPSSMALLMVTFAPGPARNRALSIYSAVLGAGASLGLVLGGVLTAGATWRSVLLVNVPVGIAVLVLVPRLLPEQPRHPGRLDLAGTASSIAGLAALVLGLTRAAEVGWTDAGALLALGVAVVMLTAFVVRQLHTADPILPMDVVLDRVRGTGYLAATLMSAAMFGTFFLLTQYLQQVLQLDALHAGLGFLPLTVPMFVVARALPRLLARYRPSSVATAGTLLVALGTAWLSRTPADGSYASDVLGPTLVIGIGGGLSFLPLTTSILGAVRPAQAGAASGVLQVVQYTGTSIGVAALVGVVGAAGRSGSGPAASIGTAVLGSTGFALVSCLIVLLRRRWEPVPLR